MGMCDCINVVLKDVMKVKEMDWLFMLCLINVVIKDCDILVCVEGNEDGVLDDDLLVILGKMVK